MAKLIWLSATVPHPQVHNGFNAVTVSGRLCELTLTKPAIRSLGNRLPNSFSTAVAFGTQHGCWASIEIRLAVTLKKSSDVVKVNPAYVGKGLTISLKVDEVWSFTRAKKYPRWLWWAEDAVTGEVVAFVFGRRTHRTFEQLLQVLTAAQIGVKRWFTDSW